MKTSAPLRMAPELALVIVCCSAGAAENSQVAQAQQAQLRADLAELRARPETPRRLGEESRLLFYLAESASNGGEKERLHEEGKRIAQRAREQDPREPAALLWWTAHRGSEASPLNPFKAVRIAREVEESLLQLRTVDADYDFAAADRVLGRLYQVAPAVISVGDMKKAGRHFAEAMRRFPEFPGNQLFYADWLVAMHRCEQAASLLRTMLASKELDAHPLDAPKWREDGQKLLRKAEGCQ